MTVPTFVFGKDQLQGNISLLEALAQFAEKGEMRHEALALKNQLQGTQP
ncbi:MAG TPA: hypothetical protein VNJ29_03140 [Candidatus Nitrosotenuis sp.]|jgi:hypothetical protein|nr:hypothetical protein [Candidatus Nitrosotenuis sp.]